MTMEEQHLRIDGNVLCKGLELASSRSAEPILCLIRSDAIRFIAVSGLRLIVSWETRLRQPVDGGLTFIVPPLVAELLSAEAICSQVEVALAMRGQAVITRLTDHLGDYEIRWKSDLASFPAPEAFGQLIAVPDALMDVPYIRFSDAIHQAVAKLVRIEADEQINPSKLAILIDLDFGGLRVNGEEIVTAESRRYYFDPRLVIRALELLKQRNLRVSITPLGGQRRAYLSLLSQEEAWSVHCSLLSIGLDTQRLYPLPPGRDR
jgi:hypothetical protein